MTTQPPPNFHFILAHFEQTRPRSPKRTAGRARPLLRARGQLRCSNYTLIEWHCWPARQLKACIQGHFHELAFPTGSERATTTNTKLFRPPFRHCLTAAARMPPTTHSRASTAHSHPARDTPMEATLKQPERSAGQRRRKFEVTDESQRTG